MDTRGMGKAAGAPLEPGGLPASSFGGDDARGGPVGICANSCCIGGGWGGVGWAEKGSLGIGGCIGGPCVGCAMLERGCADMSCIAELGGGGVIDICGGGASGYRRSYG
jgi:hypothetical protein